MFVAKSHFSSVYQALLLMLSLSVTAANSYAAPPQTRSVNVKHVIGPTAMVEETESDLAFAARVDTGATTSSLHVEDWNIEDEADVMAENVGKTIRFRLKNRSGESDWLERKIVEISVIKTSEQEERRYKVPMTLNCLDVKKRVLVSLNDRSHMTYPVLLGRNFLQGDFVVDVDLGKGDDLEKGVDLEQGLDLGGTVDLSGNGAMAETANLDRDQTRQTAGKQQPSTAAKNDGSNPQAPKQEEPSPEEDK